MKKFLLIIFLIIVAFIYINCSKNNCSCDNENNSNSNENNLNYNDEYIVYFISDDVIIKEVKTFGKEYIEFPTNLSKDGYELVKWTFNDGKTFDLNYILNNKITSNIVVNAVWEKNEYKINYVIENDVINDNPKNYKKDESDIILKNPIREGYDFLGWYTDKSLNDSTKIDKIITTSKKDYTLYPKWEKLKYSIEYFVEDKVVYIDELYQNDLIELYQVDGLKWYYYDNNVLKLFDYKYMPANNFKLYGYVPNTLEISFNPNGGDSLDSISYLDGDEIYLPSINHTNDTYVFDGWYYNDELISKGNENIVLNYGENIELIAKWKQAETIDFSQTSNYSIDSINDNDAVLIDFTKCNEDLSGKNITIKDGVSTVIIKGKRGITYLNFSINVGYRNSNLRVILDNFNYESKKTTAFYTKIVSNEYQIILEISGSCSIKAGMGQSGTSGTNYNQSADVNSARPGGRGTDGSIGYTAIEANFLIINCRDNSSLNIYGGKGGYGGDGGTGEGSNGPNKSTAGSGGAGGTGGDGGNAIDIYTSLEFKGNGTVIITGGTGGNGGDGGDGGHATVNYSTDDADHGGNGGKGGNGGQGGYAICFKKEGTLTLNNNIDVTLISGAGGQGGDGGDGGDTVKTTFYSAGNVGAAGGFGAGGSAGTIINDSFIVNNYDYTLLIQNNGNNGSNGYNGWKGTVN